MARALAEETVRDTGWLAERERGAPFLLALTLRLMRVLGRRPLRPLVIVVALWYRLLDRRAVTASRAWLERCHGRRPGYWEVYRHFLTFAQVTFDRLLFASGRFGPFEITRTGKDHLSRQIASGEGAVMLGAHLGSFEAMRASGAAESVPINVLGYFENAAMINAVLDELAPGQDARVIHIGADPVSATLRAQGCVERGEFVALLGDRIGLNEREVTASFFGARARFPAGPFLLASLLRCPVYLVFGLYRAPNRYDLHCEPFAERIELPRATRKESLEALVQRFAERLEHHARNAPDNWFNFFDFWSAS